MKKLFLLIVLLNLFQHFPFAQINKIDSLFIQLQKTEKACPEPCREDTAKINHLNALCREYINLGQYDSALYFGNTALDLSIKINSRKDIATAYGNIGVAYKKQGNYAIALGYYFKALKIDEALGNKKGIATKLGNIGVVYHDQGDNPKALEYYFKALKIDEEIKNKNGIVRHLGNIGLVYGDTKDYPKALQYYFKALKMKEELNNKREIAITLGNIGLVYYDQEKYNKALEYFFRSLKIKEELGEKSGIALISGNIGLAYTWLGKHDEAEKYLLRSLSIAEEINSLDDVRQGHKNLSLLYNQKGDYKNAYQQHILYSFAKDSIFNKEKRDDITRKEMNYEFEKKEAIAKAEHDKQVAVATEERKKEKAIRYSIIGGLILMLIVALVIFRSLKITRKQKGTIEHQKHLVEEKQKEILDSITYAKRLQQAILPPLKMVTEHLPESFIFYKPKDIVAGDFYWMEKKDDLIFIAAADCTGHGVPGALVSVVCSNALNRTVKEFGITEPGNILNKVRELVIETFEKSESEVKDGMDISLCSLNKITGEFQWAGANNPLWLVRQNGYIVEEYKGDKQPIGKMELMKPFQTHNILLEKDDSFYIFTDGYADQFGGDKGKKFKYSKLKELLLSVSNKEMPEQKQILDETFETWKGNLEQVDDVCIIGIRL